MLPVEEPLRGDELAALARVAATPPDVVERVMHMLKT